MALTVKELRLYLTGRPQRCAPLCPGLFMDDDTLERCDDCAHMNGLPDLVAEDFEVLPEVAAWITAWQAWVAVPCPENGAAMALGMKGCLRCGRWTKPEDLEPNNQCRECNAYLAAQAGRKEWL